MPVNEALLHNWFYGNYGVRIAASLTFAYLLGSIPVGAVVRWLFSGMDPRLARAANAIVPAIDALKGFIATIIPLHGGGETIGLSSGLAATIGHYYTPWRGLRGDWSVGLFAGVVTALSPLAACIVLTFWFVVSVGSGSYLTGTLFAAATAFWPLWFFIGAPAAFFGIAAGTALGLRLGGSCQVFQRLDV
jgi:glycerol-3-phosphate acyltransferase PlsY